MQNPISIKVRGWLYVFGIVVGGFVAVVLPDVLLALGAGDQWLRVATRGVGALALLLSVLSRANLSDSTQATEQATEAKYAVTDGAVPDIPDDPDFSAEEAELGIAA